MTGWDFGPYLPRPDPYAAHRCECGHLVYADEDEGGDCRYCSCTDHRRPA